MQNRKPLKKLHTQYTLLWCLKVGDYLGTLDPHTINRELNIKPAMFQRWLSGMQMPPEVVLNKIKIRAFAPYRIHQRKKVLRAYPCDAAYQPDLIETKYLWKLMLFDEMNMLTKSRFCKRLKKTLLLNRIKRESDNQMTEMLEE